MVITAVVASTTPMSSNEESLPRTLAQASVRNICTPKHTALRALHRSPRLGLEPLCSSKETPTSAAVAENHVIGLTPRPDNPARNGTTSTVNVDRKEAREASVVSRPSACKRYPTAV